MLSIKTKIKDSGILDGLKAPSKKRTEELNKLYGSKDKQLINMDKIYINQEITDFIIQNYGEKGLDGIISGELLVHDRKLSELMGNKQTFKIPVGNLTDEEIDTLVNDTANKIKSNKISEDFFIPVQEPVMNEILTNLYDFMDVWNYNVKDGDKVKFKPNAVKAYNAAKDEYYHRAINPDLQDMVGVVVESRCEIHAYAKGSFWTCIVDFNGTVLELPCGFFVKEDSI